MSLLFIDGFNHYATADIAKKNWLTTQGAIVAGGRNGQGFQDPSGYQVFASRATYIVGFAFKVPGLGNQPILRLRDSNVDQCSVNITVNGEFQFLRGGPTGGGTVLATSAVGLIPLNTWLYIELKVTINNATGSFELRRNGSNIISGSGLDTQITANASANQIFMDWPVVATVYDDLYIADDAGAVNNTFLGDLRIEAIYADANGANNGWAPSTGVDRYATIDEAPPNDDTDYNSSATPGDKFTCEFQNISLTGSIKGLHLLPDIRKDDAGSRQFAPVVRHAAVDYDGLTVDVTDTYNYHRQMYETNPGTTAAWTVGDVNNGQFGGKVIT